MSKQFHVYNSIKEYRSDKTALNYSYLKQFSSDPIFLNTDKQTDSLSLGDIIDILLTQDESEITKRYYILKENESISPVIQEIVKDTFDSVNEDDKPWFELENYKELLGEIIVKHNYYNNRKLDTNINNIVNTVGINDLVESYKTSLHKIVIPASMYDLAQKCVRNLKTNPYTTSFTSNEKDGFEIINQFALKVFIPHFNCNVRVLVDRLEINHNLKQITPLDFKSTSKSVLQFKNEVFKYRYDLQGSLYTKAIETWCEIRYPDYKVNPLEFIVVETQGDRALRFTSKNLIEPNLFSDTIINSYGTELPSLKYIINSLLKAEEIHYLYGYDYGEQLLKNTYIEL
jgi:hypothetical protein